MALECHLAEAPRAGPGWDRRSDLRGPFRRRGDFRGLGACSDLRRADVLRGLRGRPARSASVATGHSTDCKHGNDNYDDDERATRNPPAEGRFLLLLLLIVRVRAVITMAVRRLAVRGLSTLPVWVVTLWRRATADEALRRRRRARIGRDCCGPGLAVPVPEETLSAARIGIPPRARTHGQSLCCEGWTARWKKRVVTRHTEYDRACLSRTFR